MNNETLEEAALKYSASYKHFVVAKHHFYSGANWQKEKDKIIHGKLIEALKESNLQLEYLNNKFTSTATTNSTISRNNQLLKSIYQ